MKGKKNKVSSGADFKAVLIKKALGYDATEVVEEYVSGEEGKIKLTKKKVTKKNVPPDLSALKMLLFEGESSVEQMTDEQLIEERNRLLSELTESEKGEEN